MKSGIKTAICLGCNRLENEEFQGLEECPLVPKGIELYRAVIKRAKNKGKGGRK